MAQPQGHDALAVLPLLLLVVVVLLPGAATAASYSSLCRTPTFAPDLPAGNGSRFQAITFPDISTGHFSGGNGLHFAPDRPGTPRSFSFYTRRSVVTTDPALLHLSATLTLVGTHRRRRSRPHSVSFDLDGYYSTADSSSSRDSESSELCMVGTGSYAREDGFGVVVVPDVVLRLHVPRPSNLSRPFITGSLEGAEFGAVTLVAYAAGGDYKYGEAASCPSPPAAAHARVPRRVRRRGFSSCFRLKALLRGSSYNLEYAAAGGSPLRQRHQRLYINQMHCARGSADYGKLRAYMALEGNNTSDARARVSNYTVLSTMHPFLVGDEALVAEGFMDTPWGQLCLKACRVEVPSGSARANLTVRECGIGISLWFPTVWSIRDRSVVAGMIWNTSKASSRVSVSRGPGYADDLSYIVYNYTLVEEAKKHYYHSNKQPPASSKDKETKKGGRFPGGYSYRDFAFSFYGKKHGLYGYASPVAIGLALVQGNRLMADDAFYSNWTAATRKEQRLLNISYDLQYSNSSATTLQRWRRVSAEGVYDTETGSLCMVACQVIGNGSSGWDCEVLVTAQFAPVDAAEGEARDRVAGTISSLRKHGDPLFFEALEFVAGGMYSIQRGEAVSRMDMERVMLVVSMTLSCAFTALQLLHVKRHPEALPATSVTMLVVLAAGCAVPLLLNLEAMFADTDDRSKHFVQLTSAGMLELNELMLRASSMLAFVLQLRLLQLALSSRRTAAEEAEGGGGGGKQQAETEAAASSDAERSALWVCLPLYLLGAVLVWVVHINDADGDVSGRWNNLPRLRARASLVDDLAAYAGLVLDGFLLPQVVWNAFAGSATTVPALSPWFYAGGSAVRAAPHVYDLLRRRDYVPASWAAAPSSSYVYASPRDDLFGAAWDVAVPCGAAVLVALIFLQQRLGGAFLCSGRRRRPGEYEMVATASS